MGQGADRDPRTGSSLAGDDRRTHPHEVSHAAIQSVGAGVDHLHALRRTLTGRDPAHVALHTYAPFTLIRAALENAAAAVWLVAPAGRPERLTRRLRLEMKSLQEMQRFFRVADIPGSDEVQRRQDRVFGLADTTGIDHAELTAHLTITEVLKEAEKVAGLRDDNGQHLAVIFWRICSALAHGDKWVLPLLDLEVMGSFGPGVHNVRVSAPVPLFTAGVHASLALVHTARQLYEQRAAAPFSDD